MLTKVHVMILTTRAISKLIIPGIKIFSACLFKDFKISKFSSYNGGKNVEYSTSEHKARTIASKVQEKAQIVLHRYTSHHVRIFSICLLY